MRRNYNSTIRTNNNSFGTEALRDALPLEVVAVHGIYEGEVNGVMDYGVFITLNARLDDQSESKASGLAYRSELAGERYTVGDPIQRCKVLTISGEKLSLGLKPEHFETRGGRHISSPRRASGRESRGANAPLLEADDRAQCQNYLLGLCTFPHPWVPGTRCCTHGSHEPRPAGCDKWLANQNLDKESTDRHRGWAYGGKLAATPNGQKAALGYRRVGVDAIEALRKQYANVMGNHFIHEPPFKKLFFAYPDEEPAPNGKAIELWSYKSADTDLPGAVFGIRRLVEVLLGENARLGAPRAADTYLLGDDPEERLKRWKILYYHAMSLNRNSTPGPDVPLQWSAHAQLNHYDHTEVTEGTLVEIVAKLGVILEVLFTGRIPHGVKVQGVKVNPRVVAPALRAAFAAPSIIDANSKRVDAAHNNPRDVFQKTIDEIFEELGVMPERPRRQDPPKTP